MKNYVVYEVWTRARIIEAESDTDAYRVGCPELLSKELNLCNWHIVEVGSGDVVKDGMGYHIKKGS